MLIQVGKVSSYGASLDSLIKRCGGTGNDTVTLSISSTSGVTQSAQFKMRMSDLYLTAYSNSNTSGFTEFGENYNDMASPAVISRESIEAALGGSQSWNGDLKSAAGSQKQLKIIIFCVSEAARFMIVRSAVNRAVNNGEAFAYADFADILHKWTAMVEAKEASPISDIDSLITMGANPDRLIDNSDINRFLPSLKPTWSTSSARTNLLSNKLLF